MWTIGQVVTEVRRILQDTGELDTRIDDADIYQAFNLCMVELRRLRPDLFLGQAYTAQTLYTDSDAATAVPVDNQFVTTIIYFIVGYVELRNDEFTNDMRAGILLTKFAEQVTGTVRPRP